MMAGSCWKFRRSHHHLQRWAYAQNVEILASKSVHTVSSWDATSTNKRKEGLSHCAPFPVLYPPLVPETVGWSHGDDFPPEVKLIHDESFVEFQSKAIRNILDDGLWDKDMQLHLNAFTKFLSPTLVARVLNQVNNVKNGQSFFSWAAEQEGYKHDTFVYNALIMKLGLVEDFDAIEELLTRMQTEECPLTGTTFAIVIQSYGRAGLLEQCWASLLKAERLGVKCDARVYRSLLSVLFNAGRVRAANRVLSRMEKSKVEFDLHIWFTIIQGLCKKKMLADALKQFDRMMSSGCTPNAHIFNAIILCCCESGNGNKAILYHKMMQQQGCQPDTYTFNTLVQAYCLLGRFSEAEAVVSDMKEAGCEPNSVTFNILLQNHMRVGGLKEVHDLLNTMQEKGFADHITYRLYCGLLKRTNNINKLISLAGDLHARYGQVDVEVVDAIVEYYCEKGNLDEAVKYLDGTFVSLSTTPNGPSFAPMVSAYCNSGDVDSACSLLSLMVQRGHVATTTHYDAVVVGFCKQSRPSEALQFFKEMNVKGVESGSFACESLLMAISDAGMVDEAMHLCDYITCKKRPVTGLPILSFMKCAINSNQLEESKILLQKMMRAGCIPHSRSFRCCLSFLLKGETDQVEKYLNYRKPNVIDYAMLVQTACRQGKLGEAKIALSAMKERGLIPTPSCYGRLSYLLSKSEKTATESLDLFEEMLEKGLVPGDALPSYLMDSFGRCKQPELIVRFCRLAIAKYIVIREGSASVLLQDDGESELKNLYYELKQNNCLAEKVLTYSTGKLDLNKEL